MNRLFGNRAKAAKYAGLWTAGFGLGWRQGRLSVRQRGRGTRAAVTQRARVKCIVIDKPSDVQCVYYICDPTPRGATVAIGMPQSGLARERGGPTRHRSTSAGGEGGEGGR